MTYTRPSDYADFCQSGTRLAPSVPLVNVGYQPDETPACENHNYLFGVLGDWIRWLDQQQQLDEAQFEYDAIVGVNGTYATINDLDAAMVLGAVHNKVLVTTASTINATQVISPTIVDLELVFLPQAQYSKGGGATKGLLIHGQRITVRNARWLDFSTGGDIAVELSSSSKNCKVVDHLFFNCDTGINDLGSNNTEYGNIEEV